MAVSDQLAREIADVKAAIDALDAKHLAEKAVLIGKLQALRDLKLQWNVQLDALCDAAGKDVTSA